jgi:uncharacterized membrane protein
MAVLSYIGILCLIPLLMKKTSKFAQEHAKQGFVLFLFEIAASVVGNVAGSWNHRFHRFGRWIDRFGDRKSST